MHIYKLVFISRFFILRIILIVLFLFSSNIIYSQQTSCPTAKCGNPNDFVISDVYIGDVTGTPFSSISCDPGDIETAYVWITFSANATRYSLNIYFDLVLNGVNVDTPAYCLFEFQPIPVNTPIQIHSFAWECGQSISLENIYGSWQNTASACACTSNKCIDLPIIEIPTPLISNFTFVNSCETGNSYESVTFTDTTAGGITPYDTYLWNFGVGANPATSTSSSPGIVSYSSLGTKTVTLTVTDSDGNTDIQEYMVDVASCVTTCDTADLSLTKTPNTNAVNIGGQVLFTLVVKNSGPCDVTGISVRDILPTGLTYNATNSTVPAGTSYSSGIWDLTSLTLNDGDTVTLVIAPDVGPDCGNISNTAEIITSSKIDPDSTPDSGN